MKNAFSLLELLVACAIMAILVGLGIAIYSNLYKNVELVAFNRDQAVLQQVLDVFNATGGNLAAITGSAATDSAKAAALSGLLKNSVDSTSRIEKGSVGNLLGSNLVLVAYPDSLTDDGRSRLIVDSTVKKLVIATTGAGFVVVDKSSALASGAAIDTSSDLYKAAKVSNLSGAKYASNEAYVWNEDTSVIPAPTTTARTTTIPTVLTSLTASSTITATIDKVSANLDVWIALDTTGSMGSVINSVKNNAISLYNTLLLLSDNTNVNLVGYKDFGSSYVSKIIYQETSSSAPTTTRVTAFKSAVSPLDASGGGDTPEAQFVAFKQILSNGSYWRSNATHCIVDLGDSSPHSGGIYPTYDNILTLLKSNNVIFSAVNYVSGDGDGLGSLTEALCYNSNGGFISSVLPKTELQSNYLAAARGATKKDLTLTDLNNLLSAYDGGTLVKSTSSITTLLNQSTDGAVLLKYSSFSSYLNSLTGSSQANYKINWPSFIGCLAANGASAAVNTATTAANTARAKALTTLSSSTSYSAATTSLKSDKVSFSGNTTTYVSTQNALDILNTLYSSYVALDSGFPDAYQPLGLSPSLDDLYSTANTSINSDSLTPTSATGTYVTYSNISNILNAFYNNYKTSLGNAIYSKVYNQSLGSAMINRINAFSTAKSALSGTVAFSDALTTFNHLQSNASSSDAKAVYSDIIGFINALSNYGAIVDASVDVVGDITHVLSGIIKNATNKYSSVSLDLSGVPSALSVSYNGNYNGNYTRAAAQLFDFYLVYTGTKAGTYDFNINVLVDGVVYKTVSQHIVLTN
jgi:prepilin-type N-terminal cleavage/methylation domain-containing protein